MKKLAIVLSTLLLAACGSASGGFAEGDDAGDFYDPNLNFGDASLPEDEEAPCPDMDASSEDEDSGSESDASSLTDSGSKLDAGSKADSGSKVDSGTNVDAGVKADAGSPRDSGVVDSGKKDSGSTCPVGPSHCTCKCKQNKCHRHYKWD